MGLHLAILDPCLENQAPLVHLDLMAKTVHLELLVNKGLLGYLASKVLQDHQGMERTVEMVREASPVCLDHLDTLDLRERWVLLATVILQLAMLLLQEEN